ncbi:hypothetical protein OG978_06335 [Streptomyces sp. NBC_01591]|nr:hypothetical protein [Streptomyces sp. NBC_01591]WSD67027.1 hypothetical protein OG978_06335 [Streptomyces sp. NBC_01591]
MFPLHRPGLPEDLPDPRLMWARWEELADSWDLPAMRRALDLSGLDSRG